MSTPQPEVGDQLLVNFPEINKNNTLFENDQEIAKGHSTTVCEVGKVLELDRAEYNQISTSLLDDNPIWEKIGGAYNADPAFAHVKDRASLLVILKDPEKKQRWLANLIVRVVAVLPKPGASFRPFYVNTEGHEYARYVGR